MTDSFAVAGDFSPADFASMDALDTTDLAVVQTAASDTAPLATLPGDAPAVAPAGAPAVEAEALPNGFLTLGLAPELLQAVKDMGYTQPTTVQLRTIPLAMQGTSQAAVKFNDLMVSSQTGSGKTAAFLLPVLHTLLKQQADAEANERAEFEKACADAIAKGEAPPKRVKRKDPTNPRHFTAAQPGALIVCPTRELAQQVAHDAIDLVRHCRGLRIANVVGGMPYQLQIAKLNNANLVVATPGRLLDLQRSMQLKLDKVQFLVVDEADRMLDLGFSDDLAEINQLTIERQQTMMFSATFAPRIQQLAMRVMRNNGAGAQRVQVDNPQEKHQNIKQVMFWADNAQHKRKLLDHWLRDTTINQAIVFASTQIECDGLANDLQQDGFDAVALHGALNQGLRNRRLMALREGHVQILVATDVAARGIDVPTISHVFNFGLPMKAEDYTHRIGRTGRAGRDGLAVTFAEFRDRRKIFDIEAYSRQPIKADVIPGLEPKQRFPESRPGSNFGGRVTHNSRSGGNEGFSRDRKFGGGGNAGGGAGGNGGGFNYERKGGFNDRFANERGPQDRFSGDRAGGNQQHFGAPRGDFGDRSAPFGKPAFSKPAYSKPGFAKPEGARAFKPAPGPKVFVPRDAKKRLAKAY